MYAKITDKDGKPINVDNPLPVKFVGSTPQADSTAVDVPGLVSDFNALLAKLRAMGIIAEE